MSVIYLPFLLFHSSSSLQFLSLTNLIIICLHPLRFPVMEKIVCAGVTLEVPSEMCDNINILFDIISPDTWNNHLTDQHRERLMVGCVGRLG